MTTPKSGAMRSGRCEENIDLKTFMEQHGITALIEHDRIHRLFETWGASVLFIERAVIGSVWTVAVQLKGNGPISCVSKEQSKEINRFLRQHGIKLDLGSPSLTRHGSEVRIHFNYDAGEPGFARRYRRLRNGNLSEEFVSYDIPPGW
jgi:hypothetical protein